MADTIKVSGTSVTTAVAGAIAGVMRQQGTADVQAIGAKAVNQAAKAIAIARVYLQEDGVAVACVPRLVDVDVGGQMRTAMRFTVVELSGTDHAAQRSAAPETSASDWAGRADDEDEEPSVA